MNKRLPARVDSQTTSRRNCDYERHDVVKQDTEVRIRVAPSHFRGSSCLHGIIFELRKKTVGLG